MKKLLILLFCAGLSIASLAQNVVQGEYFIDTDLGYGNNTLVTFMPSADNSFTLSPDLSSFQPGYHKLYIRTKDSDGKWSLTTRRNVEVVASEAKTTIVNGEYFIDTDPGFGSGASITITTPDSVILQNFSAVASALPEGYHKLYGRLKDNLGRWGLTFRRNMEVYKNENNLVINGEYFFTTDQSFGNCTPVTFALSAADGSFVINIPLNTIPSGGDSLFVRVRDDIENRWSFTQILNNINTALPLTLLSFTVKKQNNFAQLNWQTANEVNTAYFNVQRSIDGLNFTGVGKVNAKAGSSLQNNYTYSDDISTLGSGKVYYRLQMTDKDGKFTYSNIGYITLNGEGKKITLYPNPAHNYFLIGNYEITDTRNAIIVVRDLAGRMLISKKFSNTAEQKVNISSLSRGTYTINIISPTHLETRKLVVE